MSTVNYRDFRKDDRQAVMAMVDTFYNSPGVLHAIPTSNFGDVFDEMCDGGNHRLRGLLMEVDGKPAGYCQLSFSYSTEAGGPVVLGEEFFILPEYRGAGLGSGIFEFLRKAYSGKAKRIRLDVAPENTRAIELYDYLGYKKLPYVQMILEDF